MAKRGPKGRFVKKIKPKLKKVKRLTPKEKILAKARKTEKVSLAQIQKERAMVSRKPPTSSIMMHGAKYTLYDKKPRTKPEAQSVRQRLKGQGKAAFINPRKRKTGTQWFVYQKSRVKAVQPVKVKVPKRTGIPTSSINMHGRKYNLYDKKSRTKTQAQALRKKLVGQGMSAFLNPRRRKVGIDYFVYKKKAERKRKLVPSKKPSPRKPVSVREKALQKRIKVFEAELRRLKETD